ncbi:MAG: FtsQ-type POTRA domain-containing protein [Actinomycetaceae bacterium]|nr:FtsQ-type POTRA domain-containing protein [Actinomycetaceae bacterium]
MRQPHVPRRPERLTATGRQSGRGERNTSLEQDSVPTAALSPDEATDLPADVVDLDEHVAPGSRTDANDTDRPRAAGSPSRRGKTGGTALVDGPRRAAATDSEPDSTVSVSHTSDNGKRAGRGILSRLPRFTRTAADELSERRRERAAETRRRRVKRAGIGAGALGVVVLLGWVLFFSPLLACRNVTVYGLGGGSAVTEEQVKESLSAYDGTSLLRLRAGEVEEHLTNTVPLVRDATVTRDFPHTLRVRVTLREPVACLMVDGACVAIDAEGVHLDLPAESADALPRLILPSGQGEAGEAATLMIDVLGALDSETRGRVASVSVSSADQVTLTLTDGATVLWGDGEDNELKAQVLGTLMKNTTTASHYDVSVPLSPMTSD